MFSKPLTLLISLPANVLGTAVERLSSTSELESTGVLLLIWVGPNSNLVRLMKSTASEPGLILASNQTISERVAAARKTVLQFASPNRQFTTFHNQTPKLRGIS